MDENNINVELEEESLEAVDDGENTPVEKDKLTQVIEEQMGKLHRQAMLMGAQAMCSTILSKIVVVKQKPGKKTYRDYERLVNDIEQFCTTGLSRKVNTDGETEPVVSE